MNLGEFKAWFSGFVENLDGPPGEKQWLKIVAKVKEIVPEPTSRQVFEHYYWLRYGHYPAIWNAGGVGIGNSMQATAGNQVNLAGTATDQPNCAANWNSQQAFAALGAAEAASIKD